MAEYIERDALLKELGVEGKREAQKANEAADNNFYDGVVKYNHGEYCFVVASQVARDLPSANVVPVRECSNITQNHPVDEFICSECGVMLRDLSQWRYDEEVMDGVLCEYECKFCPECGARVKRGEGNA